MIFLKTGVVAPGAVLLLATMEVVAPGAVLLLATMEVVAPRAVPPPRHNGGRRSQSRSPPRHDRERSHRQQDLHSHIGGGYPSDLGGPAAVPPGYIRVDQVPAYMAQFAAPQPQPQPVYYPWGAPPAPGV